MTALRRLVRLHPALAALILAAALAVRVAVPAGFMPTIADGRITIAICSGYGPATMTMTIPGLTQHGDDDGHAQAQSPCAFADLALPALSVVDPIQLAAAIAYAFAAALVLVAALPPRAIAWLRPPLRGPPANS